MMTDWTDWVLLAGQRLADRVARDLNDFAGIRRAHIAATTTLLAMAAAVTRPGAAGVCTTCDNEMNEPYVETGDTE
jgi:hypothetical protein